VSQFGKELILIAQVKGRGGSMALAQLVLSYLQVLIWPCIVIFAVIKYRRIIESLVSQSKITFKLGGVSIETTLEKLERSIEDNLRGHKLSTEQWEWLKQLRDKGLMTYDHQKDYATVYPLRNAGLVWSYPEGYFLTEAHEVGISTLGKLLLEAWEQNPRSH
jgi:hypothetical protein